jgi:hypothetical protein
MSIFPITPLVRRVQGLIFQTFDVSEQQAEDCAAELVALAEGWGSPEKAEQLDWSYRTKKDLGEKLKWRSLADHTPFQADLKQNYQSNEAFISGRKHAEPIPGAIRR